MRIRPETAADVDAITALTQAAFLEAEHTGHNEHFIVLALRRAGKLTVSLVAEDAGEIVGHVAVSPVVISSGAVNWFGLGPISVSPPRQREGIGTQLMEAALAELRRLRAAGCVVLGNPRYYARFGFTCRPELILPDIPPEYFQAISFTGTFPRGTVTYDEGFHAQA